MHSGSSIGSSVEIEALEATLPEPEVPLTLEIRLFQDRERFRTAASIFVSTVQPWRSFIDPDALKACSSISFCGVIPERRDAENPTALNSLYREAAAFLKRGIEFSIGLPRYAGFLRQSASTPAQAGSGEKASQPERFERWHFFITEEGAVASVRDGTVQSVRFVTDRPNASFLLMRSNALLDTVRKLRLSRYCQWKGDRASEHDPWFVSEGNWQPYLHLME